MVFENPFSEDADFKIMTTCETSKEGPKNKAKKKMTDRKTTEKITSETDTEEVVMPEAFWIKQTSLRMKAKEIKKILLQ